MAKLGNEARLVITLAEERMKNKRAPRRKADDNYQVAFEQGWGEAMEAYRNELLTIATELERR